MHPMVSGIADVGDQLWGELILKVQTVVLGVWQFVVGCVRSEEIGCSSFFQCSLVRQVFDEVGWIGVDRGSGGTEGILRGATRCGLNRLDKGWLQGNAEGTVEAAAGRRREVREEFAAVVVETESRTDDKLRCHAVGKADARTKAILLVGKGGFGRAGCGELFI